MMEAEGKVKKKDRLVVNFHFHSFTFQQSLKTMRQSRKKKDIKYIKRGEKSCGCFLVQ